MNAYELAHLGLSMLDIFFGIDVAIVISPVLRINFAKIHMDNEVVLSITLLFGRMFSLVKISLSVMNHTILLPY